MATNVERAQDWARMAKTDIERSMKLFKLSDFSGTVLHAQLSVEKMQKSLLALAGVEVKRTHAPSRIVSETLLGNSPASIKVDEEAKKRIKDILELAVRLEAERTIPRYGIEMEEELIVPEEFYGKERTHELLDFAIKALLLYAEILKKLNLADRFCDYINGVGGASNEFNASEI